MLLQGLVSIAAAAVAVVWTGITELALFYLIAGWCIATGLFEIVAAIQMRRQIPGPGLMALSGVLSIILGVLLGLFPLAGLLVLALWVAAWAIVYGVVLIVLGIRLRSLARHGPQPEAATMPVIAASPPPSVSLASQAFHQHFP